jgi:hypothetical protein
MTASAKPIPIDLRGCDDVRGMVIGDISFRYEVDLKTVQVWTRHGRRQEWPARRHRFSSTLQSGVDALTEYLGKHRREERLGDGTPCITTLEPAA